MMKLVPSPAFASDPLQNKTVLYFMLFFIQEFRESVKM